MDPLPPPPDLIDHSSNHTEKPKGYGYLVHTPTDGKMHFPQWPDFYGLDINFSDPKVLADDWKCTETGPVTDIHFWFSAQNDWFDIYEDWRSQIQNIHVSIHANIPDPDGSGPLYSMPGAILWEMDFVPDSVFVTLGLYGQGEQGWYDPNTGEYWTFDHMMIYLCNIVDIPDPFIQQRDSIYWLDVSVTSINPLGWKTADVYSYPDPYTGMHYEDDAVWGDFPNPIWQELRYPPGHQQQGESIDLAFVITGEPPEWNPGDPHKMHFPQLPDTLGLDINFQDPKVLADDWRCSESGTVKDIHFWFSALGDWFNITEDWREQIFNIHVSIHANIPDPDGATGPLYSMPGCVLWERDFIPDYYHIWIREYGWGDQGWYDPNTGDYFPFDHFKIYQCNIVDIPEPFTQYRDSIYWLDVSITSLQPLGWKTSDRWKYPEPYTGWHYEDDAVWGDLPDPLWQELVYPPGGPYGGESIDLSFVITGDTVVTGTKGDIGKVQRPYMLEQNYPNPFNPNTTIRYEVPENVHVRIAIYNVKGEPVRVLVNEQKPAGQYGVVWDGRNASGATVASGVYFCRMQAGTFVQAKKVVFLK